MIQSSDILAAAATRLANNAALNAWAVAQFGRAPKIYVGLDHREPPGESDAPWICLRPFKANDGQEIDFYGYMVRLDWCIVKDTKTTVGTVTTYAGVALMDTMGKLIWDALVGLSDNIALSERELEFDPDTPFPMFLAGAFITLTVPSVIGGEIQL